MLRKLSRVLKIAHSQYSNLGFREFSALVFRSLFKIERIAIYSSDLANEITRNDSHVDDGYIKKGDIADLALSRRTMAAPPWELSCDLYDGVKDHFIYKKNGVIGHISWIYYKNDPNRIIELRSDEGEVKYSLTLPEFRGKGIYPEALREVQRYLKEKGYKMLYICTREDNVASVRGIEKAGFTFIKRINLIKVLGMQVSKRYATGR
ncbi:MAG TPA: GNAT family N-acetyltransferase [Syntrophales bacterium]|nr:GNAT family N-acetyltransferase [Syntrophales bacterium]